MNNELYRSGAGPRKRRTVSLEKKKARSGWLFVLPFLLSFIIIYVPIVFDSIKITFNKIAAGYKLTPVGFENYQEALFGERSTFVQELVSGLSQLVLDIPAIVIFSLFMAVILNQKMFGRAVFRAIFFVPVILSTGLIAEIDSSNSAMNDYMSNNEGIDTGGGDMQNSAASIISYADVTVLFSTMKVGGELVVYVTNLVNDIYNIINRSGVQMLIFLAGLQSISPAIYESCSIDGATAWETFWKITFPMISPMILVNAVYTVIDSFTTESNPVMQYVMDVYTNSKVYSSAMSWMYFLIVVLVIAAVAGIFSAFVFYQRRD